MKKILIFNIMKKTKKNKKKYKNQKAGGPLVKVSKEMLENISAPSGELYKTESNCAAISLYFLGIFGEPMKKLLKYIKKYLTYGLDDEYLLQNIREYENIMRRENKLRLKQGQEPIIIEDKGKTVSEYYNKPFYEKEKLEWYKEMTQKIFDKIPPGYATFIKYVREVVEWQSEWFENVGHIVISVKGQSGSLNLLDLQSGILIRCESENNINEIINYFNSQDINSFTIYSGGLSLKPVEKPITGIPGHRRRMLSPGVWLGNKKIKLVETISTNN